MLKGRAAFSVEEVAELLGLHVNTVRRAVWRGDVRAVRIGRRVLIPRAEVERLLGQPLEGKPGGDTSELYPF
jgi:excisionase family DNA binding protein